MLLYLHNINNFPVNKCICPVNLKYPKTKVLQLQKQQRTHFQSPIKISPPSPTTQVVSTCQLSTRILYIWHLQSFHHSCRSAVVNFKTIPLASTSTTTITTNTTACAIIVANKQKPHSLIVCRVLTQSSLILQKFSF